MLDVDEQLARLRQRVAAIDPKFKSAAAAAAPAPAYDPDRRGLTRSFIEEWSDGQVVNGALGSFFQMERTYAAHRRHGSADIGALAELPHDFLDALSENEIPAIAPERWAFLDTETTGLAGGSGTYAFLIGVGRITPAGFVVRQFFMRDYVEERAMLAALDEHLSQFDVLITYNGRSYDQPLLETRYRMHRAKTPFARLGHLDLLYGSRRIWKLRLENCRLMQLEQDILGVCREGDLPGEMIPYVYFEYLRQREAQRLIPIFHHNAIDILTLACLTAIVPAVFRQTDADTLVRAGVHRGTELTGIARWLRGAGEFEKALDLFKRALAAGLPDRLLFRTLWDVGCLEKKLGRPAAAQQIFLELSSCRNDFRVQALEELAKFSEREERNFAGALAFTEQALAFGMTAALTRRKQRLEARLAKYSTRRLL